VQSKPPNSTTPSPKAKVPSTQAAKGRVPNAVQASQIPPQAAPPVNRAESSGFSFQKLLGKSAKALLKIVIPLLILAIGAGGTLFLIKQKKPTRTRPSGKDLGKPVRVVPLQRGNYSVTVKAQASTESLNELTLAAEIGGKVKRISPDLIEGGWVRKNQFLFSIDDAELQLKIQQAKANLAKAEYEVDLVKAQKEAADQGLKAFQSFQGKDISKMPTQTSQPSALARYEPQMKQAEAGLKSVIVSLKQAELNLKRTKILAPFSGYVRSVSLSEGQIISPGLGVAKIFRGSPVIVKVQVPLSDLEWIKVAQFKDHDGQLGSMAVLTKKIGKTMHQWRGRVIRRLQEINALGRLAVVVIEIDKTTSNRGFTLPLGMFVDVAIVGKTLENTFRISHESLRQNSTIWVMTKENKLSIRSINILRKDDKFVYFRKGIKPGEKLITSPLSDAVNGMKLRKFSQKTK